MNCFDDKSLNPSQGPIPPLSKGSDVLIIGAGPAGSAAAIVLARAGMSVTLIDQHTFPRDKICGDGLIPDSMQALESLGVLSAVLSRARSLKGLACHGPGGGTLHIPGNLAVLPRKELDMILVQKAIDLGARLVAPARFLKTIESPEGVVCGVTVRMGQTQQDLLARWVILATGASAGPLKAAGVCLRPLPSAMALRTYVRNPQWQGGLEHLEISWHRSYAPGYGWVFPLADGLFNVGVGLYGMHQPTAFDRFRTYLGKNSESGAKLNLNQLFDKFVNSHPRVKELVHGGTLESEIKGAPLRCSLEGAETSRPGLLVTGEAIGSTYALTGEGIGKAMETGMLAAQAILDSPDNDTVARQQYSRSLDAIRYKFAIYQKANIINRMPWLINLAIQRGNASPRLVHRMSLVLEEKANPAKLFTIRGAWKFLTE